MTSRSHPLRPGARNARRVIVLVVGAVALVGIAIAGRALIDRLGAGTDEVTATAGSDTDVATADIRDLSETFTATGTLQYDPSIDVVAPIAGTVLRVVEAGSTLANGDVIATIDGQTVVWLDGAIPAWRSLTIGDEGPDVLQLETALAALGLNADGDVTVDEEYTSATAAMVEDWQEALGAETTGRVDFGSVLFGGARSRVSSTAVEVGDTVTDGATIVAIGTTTRYALLDAVPAEAVTLRVGDTAMVELPDRSSIEGTVASIAPASESWQITIEFDSFAGFPATDVSNVEMSWDHDLATDVLTVPSSSLLRIDNGTYVVEVVADDGTTLTTPVTFGVAVGTRVQILDGLDANDQVIAL